MSFKIKSSTDVHAKHHVSNDGDNFVAFSDLEIVDLLNDFILIRLFVM